MEYAELTEKIIVNFGEERVQVKRKLRELK